MIALGVSVSSFAKGESQPAMESTGFLRRTNSKPILTDLFIPADWLLHAQPHGKSVKTQLEGGVAVDSRESRGTDRQIELLRPQNAHLDCLRSVKDTDLLVLSFILPGGGLGRGVQSEEPVVVSWEERSITDESL